MTLKKLSNYTTSVYLSKPVKQSDKTSQTDMQAFLRTLKKYQGSIDKDIVGYNRAVKKSTLEQYGSYARLTTDTFLDILGRGGKRIRGALVCLGYEMSGGKDTRMILQAARALEMIQAYILIIDDIQDRSLVRRGGPSAHVLLADYHRRHELSGDANHFGLALALNAALGGAHAAQMILANLPASEENRLKVISIVNRTMLVTAHGQTNDILSEFVPGADENVVERVLEWKTAHYSFLNPLHVGMVLAGAGCQDTDAITDYAVHTGKAFQITDDIIGMFGDEQEIGKSQMDDIKEGKRTVLTIHALNHAPYRDKKFLLKQLGNAQLTRTDFERCKEIVMNSGSLDYAKQRAEQEVVIALKALDAEQDRWSESGVQSLRGLAEYILTRHS